MADFVVETIRVATFASDGKYVGRARRFATTGMTSADDVLSGYEKLRNVGKGAYGTAVLYRRRRDDALIVIKEINMVELTAVERQMALNEVQVLKMLDHPNIISYYGSFERDGMLLIEMEYADGGTLSQFLSRQSRPLAESDVLAMFEQVVSAIDYMHGYNVLHRDLKTANVFLTRENVVKVGDFGISKVMTKTFAQAHSLLGTPHYISPEMCEGKDYDHKSDVWALGCILYEMACLQKTFEGTNLPALVNKIVKGTFRPVPPEYSQGFRSLVRDVLARDPALRPTAAEILDRITAMKSPRKGGAEDAINCSRTERSVLYEVTRFGSSVSLVPVPLPPRFKIADVAVSNTHFIALTAESMVYAWGEGGKGELGCGVATPWRAEPRVVEALRDKKIKMIAAGDGFSVFGSESGTLMTCGDGSRGCLGHDDRNDVCRPKLLEKLLSVDVVAVSCGQAHVCAVTANGNLYAWGSGKDGRLGLGDEEDRCSPTRVDVGARVTLGRVRCGRDATIAIAADGALLACGRNSYNKLGLSPVGCRYPSFASEDCETCPRLRRARCVSSKIADASLGANHTTLLTVDGEVITMGRNSEGQLGRRSGTEPGSTPTRVDFDTDKRVTMIGSGPAFTVAGTAENEVYFWGTGCGRFGGRGTSTSGAWSRLGESHLMSCDKFNLSHDPRNDEVAFEPVELLALYASPRQIEKGETVRLSALNATRNGIYITVDTTIPPVSRESNRSEGKESAIEESECSPDDDDDDDGMAPIPNWIKEEVARSEVSWQQSTGRNPPMDE